MVKDNKEKTMLEIRIPATSANLGPGFDCLGFAIKLYNSFIIEEISTGIETVINDKVSGKEIDLSLDDNLFYHGMKKVYDLTNNNLDGIKLTEIISIPLARGLGSSATAVVAGLLAANIILDYPFTEEQLIDIAVEMEGHPDNVLPALKGGFVINVITEEGLVYKKIELDQNLNIVLVIPDFKLKTGDVRKVLPEKLGFKDAIFNLSRTALLTSSLQDNNLGKLKIAMEDKLHQDYRAKLIPGFHEVIASAYQQGALGVALSGAGPSMLAIVNDNAEQIGEKMVASFSNHNIKSEYIVTKPDNKGVIIRK
mgnify:CR=1 FL=1